MSGCFGDSGGIGSGGGVVWQWDFSTMRLEQEADVQQTFLKNQNKISRYMTYNDSKTAPFLLYDNINIKRNKSFQSYDRLSIRKIV